jgi:hypothetical protein
MAGDEWVDIPADDEWETIPAEGVKSGTPGVLAGGLAAAGAVLPAVVAGGKRAIEEIATHPNVAGAGQRLANLGGMPLRTLSTGKQIIDVVTGKQSPAAAVGDAVRNEVGTQVLTRAPGLLQQLALRLAPKMSGMTGVGAGGAMIGAAVPAALLAGMQHDQQIDRSDVINQPGLAGDIARALMARQRQ